MKTLTVCFGSSFRIRSAILMALVIGIIGSHGEELNGTVQQPEAPFDAAPDSVVTVFEADAKTKVAGPDTFGDGHYRFEIEKGKVVIVQARWRPQLSRPGTRKVVVQANPTEANVQLLPPSDAAGRLWEEAGKETAKLGGTAVNLALSTLQGQDVPAASLFEFVRGAQSVAKPFKGLAGVEIFASADPQNVAQALQQVEKQFATYGSIPTYQELAPKLDGPLTKEQHLEVLGFIAPQRNSKARTAWEAAVGRSVGPQMKAAVLDKEATFEHMFSSGDL